MNTGYTGMNRVHGSPACAKPKLRFGEGWPGRTPGDEEFVAGVRWRPFTDRREFVQTVHQTSPRCTGQDEILSRGNISES
jgi:hypothetical protein